MGEFLRHQDRVAVVRAHDTIELLEPHDGRNELVRDALNAVATHLVTGRHRGRFGRLEGMYANGGVPRLQVRRHAHHGAARADSGHERVGGERGGRELRRDLRAGRAAVRLDVGGIGELARQEHIRIAGRQFLRQADAAEESALRGTDRHDLGAEAGDDAHALGAHPVGHEDGHRVPQRTADGGERDAGVAAGGLSDAHPGPQGAAAIRLFDDEERHPVLDAAGEVQRFLLREDHPRLAAEDHVDGQQRRIADQAVQAGEALGERGRGRCSGWRHGASLCADSRPAAGRRQHRAPAPWLVKSTPAAYRERRDGAVPWPG